MVICKLKIPTLNYKIFFVRKKRNENLWISEIVGGEEVNKSEKK